ncbi:hypothetical protein L901_04855 [Agrobacterium sp. D14]|uniref:hypothetical protein n=1 Tax=Agrobacterium TaxID=357 RepID=UPI000745A09D|nr:MULTISPECIES: hypothetical protein [Agrobacterium]KVK48235.1 hypothetical protein L901_04855 [Agrobacterium sp. D14]
MLELLKVFQLASSPVAKTEAFPLLMASSNARLFLVALAFPGEFSTARQIIISVDSRLDDLEARLAKLEAK